MLRNLLLAASLLSFWQPARESAALPVIETAIERMGGVGTLSSVERARLEMITQWQRTSFRKAPYADLPSYEHHVELRDYTIPAWRNTRRFPAGGQWREVTDLVRDSVAARHDGRRWVELNVTYVDEQREIFTFAPERVLLHARAAADLRLLPDTVIDAQPHARITATLNDVPATLFIRRSTGLLAMVRYRAAHPNDFGLTSWGPMETEIWFSNWQRTRNGMNIPMQWDVRRVGRPYKRMTVLSADFAVAAMPDSFAISDSLRMRFLTSARRPMHDVALDSAMILDGGFARFAAFGSPNGAVRIGGRWVLLEAGVAPLSVERALAWLQRQEPGARVAGALVTVPAAGNGGVVELGARSVPMYVGAGATPFVRQMLHNHGQADRGFTSIESGRWLPFGADSLWVEPFDLPNAPGSTLVYAPTLRWLYAPMALSPLDIELVLAHVRHRGWTVERVGTVRGIVQPVVRSG